MLAQIWRFVYYGIENIVGKGQKNGSQHFLLFPQCFQKASSSGSLTLSLLMTTQGVFVDSAGQEQTAQNVQSDL